MEEDCNIIDIEEEDGDSRAKDYLSFLASVLLPIFVILMFLMYQKNCKCPLHNMNRMLQEFCQFYFTLIRLLACDIIDSLCYICRIIFHVLSKPFAFIADQIGLSKSSHVKVLIDSISKSSDADSIGKLDDGISCKTTGDSMLPQYDENEMRSRVHRRKCH
ncbi:unnamed protein product [Arctia plantaginis]|uniref:Uncharacterized protein n=1 Tax=Arctia plantaginis TaxID=874455 RepID=A0A8S0Z4E8_ARCPL|nr:unnamed protein product [Arctia plantaginis]CAB3235144.1 unnamed protein product [Arctia plantaginis]